MSAPHLTASACPGFADEVPQFDSTDPTRLSQQGCTASLRRTDQTQPFPWASHYLARSTDPVTSKEAAAQALPVAADHCERVLMALRLHGPLGAEQIAAVTGLVAYQVRKRTSDLEKLGRARPTLLTRQTASGRHERIWEACA